MDACERCAFPEVVENYMCAHCLALEENYYIEQHNLNVPEGYEECEYVTPEDFR